jgi:hypothetical protein
MYFRAGIFLEKNILKKSISIKFISGGKPLEGVITGTL